MPDTMSSSLRTFEGSFRTKNHVEGAAIPVAAGSAYEPIVKRNIEDKKACIIHFLLLAWRSSSTSEGT